MTFASNLGSPNDHISSPKRYFPHRVASRTPRRAGGTGKSDKLTAPRSTDCFCTHACTQITKPNTRIRCAAGGRTRLNYYLYVPGFFFFFVFRRFRGRNRIGSEKGKKKNKNKNREKKTPYVTTHRRNEREAGRHSEF